MKGWLVAAGILGGVALLLHVGNPTGRKPKPRGSISNYNCRLENGVQMCDFGIERGFGLSAITLGRFPLDSSPKPVVVDGKQRMIVVSGSGFVLQ